MSNVLVYVARNRKFEVTTVQLLWARIRIYGTTIRNCGLVSLCTTPPPFKNSGLVSVVRHHHSRNCGLVTLSTTPPLCRNSGLVTLSTTPPQSRNRGLVTVDPTSPQCGNCGLVTVG